MTESRVTVTSYRRADHAGVAKNALDEAAIDAVVADERKVRVHNEDALRAADVLETKCATLDELGEPDEGGLDPSLCTGCGTHAEPRRSPLLQFALIAVLVLSVGIAVGRSDMAFFAVLAAGAFLLFSDRWRCAECGASWN